MKFLILKFNAMTAYQIKINVDNTPEQEAFMTFQCSVLYNGKSHNEIPITCLCSIHNLRIFSKINKLQKATK